VQRRVASARLRWKTGYASRTSCVEQMFDGDVRLGTSRCTPGRSVQLPDATKGLRVTSSRRRSARRPGRTLPHRSQSSATSVLTVSALMGESRRRARSGAFIKRGRAQKK
jgi:hypothetical protein